MPLLSGNDRRSLAACCHALSDDTRLKILERLSAGERCVCELTGALGAAQSRLSFHLRTLKDAGLVVDRPDGRWVYYAINQETLTRMSALLERLSGPVRHQLPVLT